MLHKQVSTPKSEVNQPAKIWSNILSHQEGMISNQREKQAWQLTKKKEKTLLFIDNLGPFPGWQILFTQYWHGRDFSEAKHVNIRFRLKEGWKHD